MLIQVSVGPVRRWPTAVTGVIAGISIGSCAALAASWSNPALLVLACLVIPGSILAGRLASKRRATIRIRKILQDGDQHDLAAVIHRALGGGDRLPVSIQNHARALIDGLCRLERCGVTIRLCAPAKAQPIVPFAVPFEPQSLDEADPNFPDLAGIEARGSPSWRRIKRNVSGKGGWVLVAVFGVNVAIDAFDAWKRRSITNELLLWTTLLFTTLFLRRGWTSLTEWLVVPGAVLVRKASWSGRDWRLLSFERSSANLLVAHLHRQTWIAAVGDGRHFFRTALSVVEAQFLLRAWLSPLPPPPAERLSELV